MEHAIRSPEPGDVVGGKYRVDAVVGRGGMSVVYRATHLDLDRQVAIKVLSPDALRVPEYVARLKHEARAVARIRSEHVVRVFDVGELASGAPYLVMELLVGCDLAAVLAARGPLPPHFAVMAILQACEALAEAHAAALVHRDLKPANLFLTHAIDGSPCIKVLDFGISRMPHGGSPDTDPGVVLGTPSYMAPEQMEAGGDVGPRSDIWALGAILYELLVGAPAHRGESLPQIYVNIVRAPAPRPSDRQGGIPAQLDAIVARCLAVDPGARYASVADLARALAPFGDVVAEVEAARVARVYARCRAEASPLARLVGARPRLREAAKRVAAATGAIALGAAAGLVIFDPPRQAAADDVTATGHAATLTLATHPDAGAGTAAAGR
jgi:serine/threonine-protein kinase